MPFTWKGDLREAYPLGLQAVHAKPPPQDSEHKEKEGIVIVNKKAVQPVTATLGNGGYDSSKMLSYLKEHVKNLYVVDGEAICKKAGSPKTLNVALLGAAPFSIAP